MDEAPAEAVNVPPQVPTLTCGGEATIMPRPVPLSKMKESVKPIPVRGAVVGFIRVIDMTDEEPPVTLSGAKPFTTLILNAETVRVDVALLVLEIVTGELGGYVTEPVTAPTARVFVLLPAVVAIISTLTVQIPFTVPIFAGTTPPLIIIDCVPDVAVTEPTPQVVVKLSGVAINVPAGRVSVKATPIKATVLALSRVMVSVDIPF